VILRSSVLPTLLVGGLLLGGIAYADGGGGGGKEGNVEIQWTSPTSTSTSHTYVTCTWSETSSLLSVKVKNLAPGDSCTIDGTLRDTGEFGGTLGHSITIHQPTGCSSFVFTDNVAGKSISAEGKFSVVATLTLLSSAGKTCEGGTATVTDVITVGCAKEEKKNNCCE